MSIRSLLVGFALALSAPVAYASQPAEPTKSLSAVILNWPPFYGEDIQENGFYSAVVREAFKRAGYETELSFTPWKRALKSAQNDRKDILWGAYYNDERAKTLAFSDVVMQNNEVFITRKDADVSVATLDDIKPFNVGVLAGSAQVKDLSDAGYTNLSEAPKGELNLKKLASGRVDFVLMGQAQFNFLMSEDEDLADLRGKLEVVEPAFRSYDLHVAVSKKRDDSAEIIAALNAALAEMKADGSFEEIMARFGQN